MGRIIKTGWALQWAPREGMQTILQTVPDDKDDGKRIKTGVDLTYMDASTAEAAMQPHRA